MKDEKEKLSDENESEINETDGLNKEIDRLIEIREEVTYKVVRRHYMTFTFIGISILALWVSWIACRGESFKDVIIFWLIMEVWCAILMIPLYFAFRFREWRDRKKNKEKKKGSN